MTATEPIRHRWKEVIAAATTLERHPAERHALRLLAQLPLVPAAVLQQLSGLRDGTSLYRHLRRLKDRGLVAAIHPTLTSGHGPHLWYLTDLGLATVAMDLEVEPASLARGNRLRGIDLHALLPGLPQLLAGYELLAAIAASQPGTPELLCWEQPWHRRYLRPTAKEPVTVTVPAAAVLAWKNKKDIYLLLPDLGAAPLRYYRPTLDHLLVLRGLQRERFPILWIATTDNRRADRWWEVLAEVCQQRSDIQLSASVVTWDSLRAGSAARTKETTANRRQSEQSGPYRVQPLQHRQDSSPIPHLVGDVLSLSTSHLDARDGIEYRALGLTESDRALLDLVARHPFLSLDELTLVLDRPVASMRRRRDRLISQGLLRLLGTKEVSASQAQQGLVEATADGLTLVAAQQGLSLANAIHFNGLAGGGPEQPLGTRRALMTNLAHTHGADQIFIGLIVTARQFTATAGDDALLAWHNAAASCRESVRPDGYGLYRRAGKLFGFFLEYDRGTMSTRDYHRKLAAYYAYLLTRRFERDYDGFPTILVVTRDDSAEKRIAQVARVAAVGRAITLPLLLTCSWRLDHPRNRCGLLGPIWRTPSATYHERRPWLPVRNSAGQTPGGIATGSTSQERLTRMGYRMEVRDG